MIRGCTRTGFTLVEVLVAFAVIVVIAGVLVPVVFRARAKGRQTVCLSNLRQLGAADLMYAQDHDGLFPPYQNDIDAHDEATRQIRQPRLLHEALKPYVGASSGTGVWFCPDDPFRGQQVSAWAIYHEYSSYSFTCSCGGRKAALTDDGLVLTLDPPINGRRRIVLPTAETPLIQDPNPPPVGMSNGLPPGGGNHFGGTNTVFVDGHAKLVMAGAERNWLEGPDAAGGP